MSYAIDRTTLARLGSPGSTGETPTDQYLPLGMPGFKDVHVYPFRPDVTAARRLAGDKPRTAILYTCNRSPCDQSAQVVKTNLAAIGIDILSYVIGSGAGVFPPFDDPSYRRKVAAAAALAGPRRYLTLGALDGELARDYAPVVAIGTFASRDFFSARMGCRVFQPVYAMDLAALCTRH